MANYSAIDTISSELGRIFKDRRTNFWISRSALAPVQAPKTGR